MALPIINPNSDTFEDWVTKSNQISNNVGDPANLLTVDKSNIVNAVNEIKSTVATQDFAIALAVALGG